MKLPRRPVGILIQLRLTWITETDQLNVGTCNRVQDETRNKLNVKCKCDMNKSNEQAALANTFSLDRGRDQRILINPLPFVFLIHKIILVFRWRRRAGRTWVSFISQLTTHLQAMLAMRICCTRLDFVDPFHLVTLPRHNSTAVVLMQSPEARSPADGNEIWRIHDIHLRILRLQGLRVSSWLILLPFFRSNFIHHRPHSTPERPLVPDLKMRWRATMCSASSPLDFRNVANSSKAHSHHSKGRLHKGSDSLVAEPAPRSVEMCGCNQQIGESWHATFPRSLSDLCWSWLQRQHWEGNVSWNDLTRTWLH